MFSLANHRLNSEKHVRDLQRHMPYEAPINVKQVCNLHYGAEGGARVVDYYEPMALTRADAIPDKSTMPIMVLLCDNPFAGSKNDVMPFAMEMARRGVAVFALDVTQREACFWAQVGDVFSFLCDLVQDRLGLGLTCATTCRKGNRVVLAGCGTGALLAAACLRLSYNARMREYFAEHVSEVAAYYGKSLLGQAVVSAFVSVSGVLRVQAGHARTFEAWMGKDYAKQKLASYLDFVRWLPVELPPMLLVTSKADVWRDQSLSVAEAAQNLTSCRLLEYPKEDAEQHVLENLFSVRYPLWPTSRELNTTIAAYCKSIQ